MLNISKYIYASIDSNRNQHLLPEAELVPMGNTVAEKKKVDKLAKSNNTLMEIENIPVPGFTLYKNDKKNYGSIDSTWLVIDPRGFLSRITSKNLEEILSVTGITEGLIQEKCVWARDNSQTKLKLIPISSPDYIEAEDNTKLIEGRVDIKTVQLGDTVLLQNGLKGKYLGVMSLYGAINDGSYRAVYEYQSFLKRQVIEVEPNKFFYQTDAKVLKVVDRTDTPMSKDESIDYVNSAIKTNTTFFTSHTDMNGRYYGTYGMIRFASLDAVKIIDLQLEEINNLQATALFFDSLEDSDIGMLILESQAGKRYIIDFPNKFSPHQPSIQKFDVAEVESVANGRLTLLERRKAYLQVNTKTYGLDSFKKYYKIKKCVKNNYYV